MSYWKICGGCEKPRFTADLKIVKTYDVESNSFSITVENLGPDPADGAVISDLFLIGGPVLSVSAVYSGGAGGPTSPTFLNLQQGVVLQTFPAGAKAVFLLGLAENTLSQVWENSSLVQAPIGVFDPDLQNNFSKVFTTSGPPPELFFNLEITQTASTTTPTVGQLVTFTVTIANTASGPLATSALNVASQYFLDTDFGGQNFFPTNPAVWPASFASIAPGASVSFSYTGTFTQVETVGRGADFTVNGNPAQGNSYQQIFTPITVNTAATACGLLSFEALSNGVQSMTFNGVEILPDPSFIFTVDDLLPFINTWLATNGGGTASTILGTGELSIKFNNIQTPFPAVTANGNNDPSGQPPFVNFAIAPIQPFPCNVPEVNYGSASYACDQPNAQIILDFSAAIGKTVTVRDNGVVVYTAVDTGAPHFVSTTLFASAPNFAVEIYVDNWHASTFDTCFV
jgi:hypothetical protein